MNANTLIRCMAVVMAAAGSRAGAGEIAVRNSAELAEALRKLAPGTTVIIAPGSYRGGIYLSNVAGTAEAPIVIRGAEAENPPVFSGGGSEALHLSDCKYVVLSTLTVKGFGGNGINIDDGGTFDTPAHHVTVENVTFLETGPRGNHDSLKLSGVDDFRVRKCRFEGWGGSAIDMVGCHRGVIEDCAFVGRKGFSQDSGIQIKGGSSDVLVQACFFDKAGDRAINLGGSTDLQYFRPRPGDSEAKGVTVAGSRFVGGEAAVAFVTADGGHVHHNTFVFPEKWLLRILQETDDPRFKPSRGGVFEDNLIVYDRRLAVFVNVGSRTAPETFRFRHNAWFHTGGAARKPSLPAEETDGVYQVDPKLDKMLTPRMTAGSDDPRLKGIGADAYERPRTKARGAE